MGDLSWLKGTQSNTLCSGFLPKPSHEGYGNFFPHWYLCRNRYRVSSLKMLWKVPRKKNLLWNGPQVEMKLLKFCFRCCFPAALKNFLFSTKKFRLCSRFKWTRLTKNEWSMNFSAMLTSKSCIINIKIRRMLEGPGLILSFLDELDRGA